MADTNKKPQTTLIEKAWKKFFKKNYNDSQAVFTKIIENEKNSDALYGRACVYFKMKEYESSLHDLNQFLKKEPKSHKGFHLRGLVKGSLNNTNQALSDIEKSIEINPDYADGYYDMGGCYLLLKEYQKAYDCFERCLSRDNNSAKAWFGKGMASLLKKEYNKAIEYFTIAIKLDKKFVLAILGRCEAFNSIGKKKEAQKDFKKAKKLNPVFFEDELNKQKNDDYYDEKEIEDFLFDD